MKKALRPFLILLLALLAVGLLVRWWSSLDRTAGGVGVTDINAASRETRAPSLSEAEPNESSLPKPAAPNPARTAVQSRDALLESLRTKLKAANVVPREALLTFRSPEARDRFVRQAGAYGLEILDSIPQLNTARVRYGRLEDLRDSIAANGGDFASVEGNLWLRIPGVSPPSPDPNNQGGRAPFGHAVMNAINAAGDRTSWGENVTVAVLDTGVLGHPTFAEGQITHVDLVNDGQSFHSHGTSVASMIGGKHPQAPGLSPAAQILDVRVANAEGYSVSSTLAQGIITAVDRGAQVINISLGGYGDSAILGQAVAYASQRGAVVVAAAGNDAYGQLTIPAAYEGVISVGSVDANNRQAYFSNAGAGLDLAAPGVGVVSAWGNDKIALVSGTSASSGLVSAAAASYLAWGVSPNQIAARLKADARPAFNADGVATGVGILMIKPPSRR
ncbi:MAG TPA: S8 family serine peptidase [Chthoniobacterales bacterium]|nr:S8 family serine peptidase [Chthoniobacterales bacterium]